MRIVLTGASGFIGRRLTQRLADKGHAVTPVARRQWDVSGSLFPAGLLEKADAVVHLAGEPVAQRWTVAAKARIRASRTQGTARLVEAIAQAGRPPRMLVCASAVGYYGERGDEELTEKSPAGTGFLAGVCKGWEAAAMKAETGGCRVACIRIGMVLGRGGGALGKMLTPFRLGVGGPLGSGRQWMSWIHLDDLVAVFERALKDDSISGPVNGTAPEPVRNQEFTRALGSALHRPTVMRVPPFALRLLFGEMSEVMLGSQRVLPKRLEAAGFDFRHAKVDQALGEVLRGLGY